MKKCLFCWNNLELQCHHTHIRPAVHSLNSADDTMIWTQTSWHLRGGNLDAPRICTITTDRTENIWSWFFILFHWWMNRIILGHQKWRAVIHQTRPPLQIHCTVPSLFNYSKVRLIKIASASTEQDPHKKCTLSSRVDWALIGAR